MEIVLLLLLRVLLLLLLLNSQSNAEPLGCYSDVSFCCVVVVSWYALVDGYQTSDDDSVPRG